MSTNTLNYHENFLRNHVLLDSHYRYALLANPHVDQVIDMFTKAFCRSEPMTQYLKMDEVLYTTFARAVTEKAVEDKLSVVVLDGDKVIACAIVEDLMEPGPIPDFDPKFKYILGLLEKLGEEFFSGKEFPKKHIAHLFITAVHNDYRHLGLSRQVNFQAMDLAASNGFDFIYCEFTHPFNELGTIPYLHNRKKQIGSITYKDFQFENEFPFANLDTGANSYLWEIHPNVKLRFKKDNLSHEEDL
jgi:hypothetical protein